MSEEVVGHGSVLGFGFVRPCHVATEVGGLPFESLEFICCCKSISSIQGMEEM